MNVREAIATVVDGQHLTEDQAAEVAARIVAGRASASQIAALLTALRMRGETIDEITGFVRAMRRAATPLALDPGEIVDSCGTGGDGMGTFNISTAAAFVAAAAGCKVAKHGNRSSSSASGSADVLEALGARIDLSPEASVRMVRELGIGFLFAPQYHAGARHAAEPRREIGIRTLFNTIGPLLHPAGARRQLMGVYDARLTEVAAAVLARLGSVHCLVVHGHDGLDEITLSGPTRVSELSGGEVRTYEITPEQFGISRQTDLSALRGDTPQHNARLIRDLLGGQASPARDIVALNAGAVIYTADVAPTLEAGVQMACERIESGAAAARLEQFVAATQREAAS